MDFVLTVLTVFLNYTKPFFLKLVAYVCLFLVLTILFLGLYWIRWTHLTRTAKPDQRLTYMHSFLLHVLLLGFVSYYRQFIIPFYNTYSHNVNCNIFGSAVVRPRGYA